MGIFHAIFFFCKMPSLQTKSRVQLPGDLEGGKCNKYYLLVKRLLSYIITIIFYIDDTVVAFKLDES